MEGTEAFVLDDRLEPVGPDVMGELYLGGEQLARGYLNQPELTAERFIPHPFRNDGTRLYRTGDLARCRADGVLELYGRRDRQIKLRGFRVELGEVEAVLLEHSTVSQVAVEVREGSQGDRELAAYVVGAGTNPTASELRKFAGSRLPAHMIPSSFAVLPSLPLTPSGKINHQALAAIPTQRPIGESPSIAPRDSLEAEMVAVWATVLGVDHVPIDADFFELGGHSLLAVRLLSEVRKVFNIEVPVCRLFEERTPCAVAAIVRQKLEKSR